MLVVGMVGLDKKNLFILIHSCSAAAKCEALKIIPPEPDNTTDVEDCIKKATANDKELKRININNIREVKADVLIELLNALKANSNVESLEMANVGMTDAIGRVRFSFLEFEDRFFCLLFEGSC